MYITNNLNASTTDRKGIEISRQVLLGNTISPAENKTEVFKFLQEKSGISSEFGEVVSTNGDGIVSNIPGEDYATISPRSHEEADTRSREIASVKACHKNC